MKNQDDTTKDTYITIYINKSDAINISLIFASEHNSKGLPVLRLCLGAPISPT
jgi:hypothetical protein